MSSSWSWNGSASLGFSSAAVALWTKANVPRPRKPRRVRENRVGSMIGDSGGLVTNESAQVENLLPRELGLLIFLGKRITCKQGFAQAEIRIVEVGMEDVFVNGLRELLGLYQTLFRKHLVNQFAADGLVKLGVLGERFPTGNVFGLFKRSFVVLLRYVFRDRRGIPCVRRHGEDELDRVLDDRFGEAGGDNELGGDALIGQRFHLGLVVTLDYLRAAFFGGLRFFHGCGLWLGAGLCNGRAEFHGLVRVAGEEAELIQL